MPLGIVWLAAGILVGVVAGWVLLGDPVLGGATGFTIILALLLIGGWLGGRNTDGDDPTVSGR